MSWNGYEPKMFEEKENNFSAVNGKYQGIVTDFKRKKGENNDTGIPYDFISVSFQIVENISGDNAVRRFFDKTFFLSDSQYGTKDDVLKSFCDMSYTILKEDLSLNVSDEDNFETKVAKVIMACEGIINKKANLTIYPKKDKDKKFKTDKNGKIQHTILVVKEHKKGKEASSKEPFTINPEDI